MKKNGRALKAPVSSKDHVRGSSLAKVTLVGYGDFTCPDCAKSYRAVKKIQAEMGSRLRYVFRSFPQDPLDEKSEGFAEAAESAGAQGKFWEIHDRMFENQGASTQLQLAKHAKAVGLDARQFRRDMRGHVHLARVRVVRKEGVRSGVAEVPTFFINSLQHESAFGLATLLPAVQAAAGGCDEESRASNAAPPQQPVPFRELVGNESCGSGHRAKLFATRRSHGRNSQS